MKFRLIEKTVEFSSAFTAGTDWIDVGGAGGDSFSCVAVLDVDTPAAVVVDSADIDFATRVWDAPAHGLSEGMKVRLTTSDTLPAPLALSTDYFVIVVDADSFKLASTLVNAQAGTAIALVDSGVGDQTVTPTALAGGAIKLQQANNTDYPVDLGSSTNITVDATLAFEKDRPTMRYIRALITLTAGHISADLQIIVKGDKE